MQSVPGTMQPMAGLRRSPFPRVAALVRCWGLSSRQSREKLLATAARKITWAQRRNARARKSHVKPTRQRLRELGIKLTELKRCQWDTTSAVV